MKAMVLMIAAVLLTAPSGAADMPVKGKLSPAASDNIHAYGDRNASCQVWTDGCRRCERGSDAPRCSNIGIACQPGPVRCDGASKPAP
ncbi:MAG: hypothetical protein K2Y71_24080 [Xanthobacteraceae bacterium]|nr:hypothetical protein [Xanthobacteraceae bacterium]